MKLSLEELELIDALISRDYFRLTTSISTREVTHKLMEKLREEMKVLKNEQ